MLLVVLLLVHSYTLFTNEEKNRKGTLKNTLIAGILATGVLGTTFLLANQVSASVRHSLSYQPLNVVDGTGTQVRKNVSFPGTLITQNNWNTDFAVPGDEYFKEFETAIIPQKSGKYDVKISFKYSDDTYDRIYSEQGVHLRKGEPLIVTATPRPGQTPYQVNIDVGGLSALGNPYKVNVTGIR